MRGQNMSTGFLLASCIVLMLDWQSALEFAAKSQEHWMTTPFLSSEIIWPLQCITTGESQ